MDTTDRSVSGIIAAFRSSLDEFKSYRERRRRLRKAGAVKCKALKEGDGASGDELKLSHSLRQGAVDVQREYDRNYKMLGDQYALGDSAAHSSLGRTLRKLNTCLHNIISSLLSLDRDVRIDYKHLTSVSDVSRQEALEALSLLSYRMSQSALSLHQLKKDEQQRQGKDVKEKTRRKLHAAKSESNITERSRQQSRSKDKNQPIVRKVQLKSASTPKLAMVRPKPRRSSSSKSESSSTPTPLPSPPPAYSSIRQQSPPTNCNPQHHASETSNAAPTRRRQDKLTPSVYTFASASTRLGEIPENRWATPYDYEAMARLNREAAGRPWPNHPEVAKPKRGFFRLFRKTGAGKAMEVGA